VPTAVARDAPGGRTGAWLFAASFPESPQPPAMPVMATTTATASTAGTRTRTLCDVSLRFVIVIAARRLRLWEYLLVRAC
jgi:hypothetical protein